MKPKMTRPCQWHHAWGPLSASGLTTSIPAGRIGRQQHSCATAIYCAVDVLLLLLLFQLLLCAVCVCARAQWRRRRGEIVLLRNTFKPMGATEKALAKSIATIAMAQIAITEDLRHRRIDPKTQERFVRKRHKDTSSTSYLLLRPTPLLIDPQNRKQD